MADHYYTAQPESAHREQRFQVTVQGRTLAFTSDSGVFSRGELDPGSRLLIESMGALSGDVLDLGCGWGPVGAFLAAFNPGARLLLSDVNERAVALAQRNLAENGLTNARAVASDGFTSLPEAFDHVVTNPPIRAGKQVIYDLFARARDFLAPGGALFLVIRKQQGAPSALKYLREIYAQAEVVDRGGGFWVIRASMLSE